MLWVWDGCQPDFPWWCDGFLWMVPFWLILFAVGFQLWRR